jgi:ABC-2 type transport system permease protein
MRRDLWLAAWQLRYEQLNFWRNRRWTMFTFAFPVMLLLIFGFLNHGQTIATRGGISFVTFYVPGLLAYALVTTAFTNLAASFAYARDSRLIKRIQGTPLPWWAYVAGRIGSTLVTIAVMTALVLAIGALAFGVRVRTAALPGLALTLALGATCLCLLGVGFARPLPSAEAVGPINAVVVLPIAFISGTFFPLDGAPGWLNTIASLFPLAPLADALQTAFDPRAHGAGLVGADLLALAIWTLIGAWLMMGFLRTQTRRA